MSDRLVVTGTAGEPIQHGFAEGMAKMFDAWRRSPKLKPIDPNDDTEIIARVKHTMRKGEKLMQWYARVGLGKAQILQMSKADIASFVETRAATMQDDPIGPPELWEAKRPPKRFLLDTFAD